MMMMMMMMIQHSAPQQHTVRGAVDYCQAAFEVKCAVLQTAAINTVSAARGGTGD